MHSYGLQSLVQIGAIFLYQPDPPKGYAKTFANAWTRARYLADVETIARAKPNYLILATEINLLYRFNRPEFENFRSLYREAYNRVKAISPNTKVGVSHLYVVWFANYYLDNVDVPAMLGTADFLAFTTYPEFLVREGHYASIKDIPAGWHGAARLAYPNASIVFSEIGWASKVLGTPALQAEFVREIPRLFSTARADLLTWAVLHDVEFYQRSLLDPAATNFLVGIGVNIDELFGHFNGMGLLDGYGNPKPALEEVKKLNIPRP
jgi:hypothetical protein